MAERNARLEQLRAGKDEYYMDLSQEQQASEAKRLDASEKMNSDFDLASDGRQPDKAPPTEQQHGSGQIANTTHAPRPSMPDRQADIESHRPGFDANQMQDDRVAKEGKQFSDLDAFKQREHETGQDRDDRDMLEHEKDHD